MNMRGPFIQDTDFSHLKTDIRLSEQESTLKYLLMEPKVRGRRDLGKLFNVAPKAAVRFRDVTSTPPNSSDSSHVLVRPLSVGRRN